MKVSIITVTFNSEEFIACCIDSVHNQTYSDIEHIIIDGGSTDKTLEIIKSRENRVETIISEKDDGIYDAMNKGLNYVTGDIVAYLNSDDLYESNNTIERIVQEFEKTECDATVGSLTYVDQNNIDKVIRYWHVPPFSKGAFAKGWHSAHLPFFAKRELYEKYGNYNTDLKIAADFEIMLRYMERYSVSVSTIPEVIGRMRVGGVSNRSLKNILEGNREIRYAFKLNGISVSPFYTIKRLFQKTLQHKL